MAERFVSLAATLRTAQGAELAPSTATHELAADVPAVSAQPPLADFAHADLVNELALVRLAAIEAFEAAAARVLRELAHGVLGRELVLAPVDIDALVRAAVAQLAQSDVVSLAVCAADAERVRSPLPLRIDPQLGAGDLIVDVHDGSFEARFAFRLESALERAGNSR